MSGPRTFGRLLLIVVGLIVVVALGLSIRHFMSSSADTQRTAATTNRGTVRSAGALPTSTPARGDPPAETPPPALHPASPWLASPPNPIQVSIQTSSVRSVKRRFSRGGGKFSLSSNEGLRVTLTVPQESLIDSQELTLELVDVSGAPFAGGIVAAVRIAPDTVALRRAATLTFETRQPVDDAQPLAGIAVRNGEMHLVRADRSRDPALRGRARVDFPIVRLGTYGVARSTADEWTAANQHEPSDYFARLEQRIARAFSPAGGRNRAVGGWPLFPVVYAQNGIFPVDDLMNSLEAFFNDVVIAQLNQLPKETCNLTQTVAVSNILFAWSAVANTLLPFKGVPNASEAVQEQEARLRAERRDRLRAYGYSDDDISFIDSMFEKYRAHIEQLNDKAAVLFEQAIQRQFANASRCCLNDARTYYLEMMVEAMRIASLQDFIVDADAMTKVQECNCRVALREGGENNAASVPVAGTITHTEAFDAKKVEERGNRTTTNIVSMSYALKAVLVQSRGAHRYGAAYDVEGSRRTEGQLWDKYPCGPQGGYTITTGSAADNGSMVVEIRPVFKSLNKYTISYSPPSAEGVGTWTSHHEPKPCTVFRTITNRTGEAQVNALTVPRQVEIEIDVDPAHPTDFRGSKDFTVDQQHDVTANTYGKARTSKVQWDLHLCAK